MKKMISKLVPLALLVMTLCLVSVAVSAAEVGLELSFDDGVITATVAPSTADAPVSVVALEGVELTSALADGITNSDITYVGQRAAVAGSAVFNFKPKASNQDFCVTVFASAAGDEVASETIYLIHTELDNGIFKNDETPTGVISAATTIDNMKASAIKSFGYVASSALNETGLSTEVVGTEWDEDGYATVIHSIPSSLYAFPVMVKPYIVLNDGNDTIIYGATKQLEVLATGKTEDDIKNVGTLDRFLNFHGIEK